MKQSPFSRDNNFHTTEYQEENRTLISKIERGDRVSQKNILTKDKSQCSSNNFLSRVYFVHQKLQKYIYIYILEIQRKI